VVKIRTGNRLEKLDRIRVATPCPVSWEEMTGDDRVRFCDLCQLNVYNFAELTRTESEQLLRTAEGRICGRLYRRADGTVITKDCPVGLRAVRRRVARITAAAFTAIVSVCSAAIGQKQSDKDKACKQQVRITAKAAKAPSDGTALTGTLYDQNGAVIAGADVRIARPVTDKAVFVSTNDEGRFSLIGLRPGTYDLLINSPGFKELKVCNVKLVDGQVVVLEATLIVKGEALLGVIADDQILTTPGTTVFKGDLIRKLPLP
jgi:hypothetical protein